MLLILFSLAAGLVASESISPQGVGTWSKLVVDGRESDVFVPTCARKGSPLIVSLHAWGTTKELQENANDKFSLPEYIGPEQCFVVVYPEGKLHVTELPVAGFSWNAGGCCPLDNSKRVDDVGYLGHVITQTVNKFNASEDLVFAVGISNGGMMANRLTCSDARIKAMVSVAGPLVNGSVDHDLDTFQCSRRVPVLHFHGNADTVVPFDGCSATSGGLVCREMIKILGKKVADALPSIPSYMAAWRKRNGQPIDQPSAITFQNGTTNCTSWGDIDSNVTLCVIDAQGHAWPGHCSVLNKIVPGCKCSQAMDASYHALAFLRSYLPAASIVV